MPGPEHQSSAIITRPSGRDAECARLDEFLSLTGRGAVTPVVIRGDIGVGKSTLLNYARDQAGRHGRTVLPGRGLKDETELPFSALGDLLEPLRPLLGRLPAGQAQQLAGALSSGRATGDNSLVVFRAVLGLLRLAGASGPLLLAVDDRQWLDRDSASALDFAVRRLDAEDVAVVYVTRTDAESVDRQLDIDAITMTVAGLPPRFGIELVRGASTRPVSDAVARDLVAMTGGNPRALVEISSRLTDDQLAGRLPVHRLPDRVPIAAELNRRLDALPATTRRGLLVAAAADTTDTTVVYDALDQLGLEPICLAAAEAARCLIVDSGGIRFPDPLLRTVALATTGPELRRVHAVLAATAGRRGDAARQVWHQAAALEGPDDTTARSLAATAGSLRAPGRAAKALERAAEISRGTDRRAGFLLAACGRAMTAGAFAWAGDLLERGRDQATSPAQQAEMAIMRAALNQVCGSAWTAHRQLRDLGRAAIAIDAERAAALFSGAALAAIQAGQIAEAGVSAARATDLVREPESLIGLLCRATRAIVAGYAGSTVPSPNPAQLVLGDGVVNRLPQWPNILPFALAIAAARGPAGLARRVLDDLVLRCRRESDLGRLPVFMTQQAELIIQDGRWGEGYAQAQEALTIARETGQHSAVTHALTVLARVEACRGETEACTNHLQEATDLAARADDGLVRFPREAARGLLHLSTGDHSRTVLVLERLAADQRRAGLHEPAVFGWTGDLIEAQLKEGHMDRAGTAMTMFDAAASPTPWTRAIAARCRGMLAAESDYEAEFSTALDLLGSALPFERARTELCLGERLRRSRRRAAAIRSLDDALDTFSRLGARPWADRARAEIAVAAGERSATGPGVARSLTPQETQVARLVAGGSSNREVAATLFLSEKTIEAHLTRIYRSLRIRSRAQLAAILHETVVPS